MNYKISKGTITDRHMASSDVKDRLKLIIDHINEAYIVWESNKKLGLILAFPSHKHELDVSYCNTTNLGRDYVRIGACETSGDHLFVLWYINSQSAEDIIDSIRVMSENLEAHI